VVTAQEEGGRTGGRQVEYFNLDAVISVGYRGNSNRGTQFRMWATNVSRDHILPGSADRSQASAKGVL
jgi:hypothetical protein